MNKHFIVGEEKNPNFEEAVNQFRGFEDLRKLRAVVDRETLLSFDWSDL